MEKFEEGDWVVLDKAVNAHIKVAEVVKDSFNDGIYYILKYEFPILTENIKSWASSTKSVIVPLTINRLLELEDYRLYDKVKGKYLKEISNYHIFIGKAMKMGYGLDDEISVDVAMKISSELESIDMAYVLNEVFFGQKKIYENSFGIEN